MKLSDAREHYEYHSGKVSEVCRQLGYAGIAVVWIFKIDGVNPVPQPLVFPTLLLVSALALDLLQYLYAAIAWGVFHRQKEVGPSKAEGLDNDDFLAPRSINWPTIFFFGSKVLCLIAGYWLLLQYLISKLL